MGEAQDVRSGTGARLLIGAALLGLAWALLRFLIAAWAALRFPYELDYGEGIVWQQALLLLEGKGYGPIDGLPAIVFHYPPVFHALSAAVAALGLDPLAAGRLVSILATLLSGALVGIIVRTALADKEAPATARLCGLLGGLATFAFWPVAAWGVLMRVDMVALAFSLAGFWLAMLALRRPAMIVPAAFCFVLAVYTKQTAVAAAAAAFLTLLLARPRTARLGIAVAAAAGLALLGFLSWATDGGFLRHILLYNINRFDWPRLQTIPGTMAMHALFFAAAGYGLWRLLKKRRAGLRARLVSSPADAALAMILLYALLASLMLVTIAKSGSNINYLIEWLVAIGILLGLASREAVRAALAPKAGERGLLTLLVPAALAVQPFLLPASPYQAAMAPSRRPALEALSARVREAPGPVISDDMVLLLRSGKAVQWEPAIFAELASTGLWDERPFVEAIRARRFAFFVTVGRRGSKLFDSRYNPAVAEAIDAAYPVKRRMAGYVVYFPGPAR